MAAGKNTHLEHLEDTIINEGSKGGEKVIKVLKEMSTFLSGTNSGNTAVTTKWDGAPAIICGTDPEDGQFFVGTKSVFAKTNQKLAKSVADVKALGYEGGLANKLVDAYKYLKDAKIKGVLQGDLMFTNDKKSITIDGKRYISFRPNTITYAAEQGSELAKNISKAKLGIVFHTKYTGPSILEMKASFDVKPGDYTSTSSTWIETAEFKDISGVASMSAGERSKYEAAIKKTEGSLKQCSRLLNDIQTGKKTLAVDTEFKKFFNKYVKDGQAIPSVNKAYVDFAKHLGAEYDKVIKKNKTLKSQADKAGNFMRFVDMYQMREREYRMLIAAYMNIVYCKNMLVKKMEKVGKLKLFVDMGGGDYKVTNPEGFVAISSKQAFKLIDRLEFSKLNFTVPKNWG